MKQTNRVSKILIGVGTVLLTAALLLYAYNQYQNWQAAQESVEILEKFDIPEPTEEEEILDAEMPIKEVDGYEYIGVIHIPKLAIELPIMAEWDYERLRIAPSRHYGSTRMQDLVIAGHNYSSHFGQLKTLEPGDEIIIIEAEGREVYYEIEKMDVMLPTQVEEVLDSQYDLTLYTCTSERLARVIAFANEVSNK